MALPPTIPTSFVPRVASASADRFRPNVTGLFGLLAYAILAIVFALALGVFFYGRILAASAATKDVALKSAEANIDPATVENFVRLRNRLSASASLLGGHIAFSGFFSTVEQLLPATTRFSSLHLSRSETGVAKVEGAGVAASFNALAATSNAFAADGRIKDAIFSNISVNNNGSVSFALSATLDPKLIQFTPTALLPSAAATPTAPTAPATPAPAAPVPAPQP
jgi:hypothetical protein